MKTSIFKALAHNLDHFDHTIFYGNMKWQEEDISQFRHFHIPIPLNAMHMFTICKHFLFKIFQKT